MTKSTRLIPDTTLYLPLSSSYHIAPLFLFFSRPGYEWPCLPTDSESVEVLTLLVLLLDLTDDGTQVLKVLKTTIY